MPLRRRSLYRQVKEQTLRRSLLAPLANTSQSLQNEEAGGFHHTRDQAEHHHIELRRDFCNGSKTEKVFALFSSGSEKQTEKLKFIGPAMI